MVMAYQSFQGHPNGYRTPLRPGQIKGLTEVDQQVYEAVKESRTNPHFSNSWPFHQRLVKLLKSRLGNIREWFDAQNSNENINQELYDFLLDTAQFIMEGRRSVSITTRNMLIHDSIRSGEGKSASKRVKQLSTQFGTLSNSEILVRWLKQPESIDDILCTLDIFFGDAQSVEGFY